MITFLSTKPAKASSIVEIPVTTSRQQASSAGALNENLSDMIITIIKITIASAIPICNVIFHFSYLFNGFREFFSAEVELRLLSNSILPSLRISPQTQLPCLS